MTQDPFLAISFIRYIPLTLQAQLDQVVKDCEHVAQQWEGIGAAGGQREDHAASLMAQLIPQLQTIATLAANTVTQIERMNADPFQRGEH